MSILIELRPDAGPVLVVGGGAVAARKARSLVEGGFEVKVVAPEICPDLEALPVTREIRLFEDSDLMARPWALVLACTNAREVNRRVGELARAQRIPVLVSDSQEESTFFSPAVFRDGDLQVAVSTGGADPALAKSIREEIIAAVGPGWAETIAAARRSRDERLGRGGSNR